MSLLDSIKRIIAPAAPVPTVAAPPDAIGSLPEEPRIPEIGAAELMAARRKGTPPQLLDCREDYERRLARIPDSLHIPVRQIPGRLNEIDRGQPIITICAHGNRSFSVAGYLIENGYRATSLRGGIAEWQQRGGEVESG